VETTTIAIIIGYAFIAGIISTIVLHFVGDRFASVALLCGLFWPIAIPFIIGSSIVQFITDKKDKK